MKSKITPDEFETALRANMILKALNKGCDVLATAYLFGHSDKKVNNKKLEQVYRALNLDVPCPTSKKVNFLNNIFNSERGRR